MDSLMGKDSPSGTQLWVPDLQLFSGSPTSDSDLPNPITIPSFLFQTPSSLFQTSQDCFSILCTGPRDPRTRTRLAPALPEPTGASPLEEAQEGV